MQKLNVNEQIWLERIAKTIEGIKFGTVQIIIHNGKIMQIEKTEKLRFDQDIEYNI